MMAARSPLGLPFRIEAEYFRGINMIVHLLKDVGATFGLCWHQVDRQQALRCSRVAALRAVCLPTVASITFKILMQ